MQDAPWAWLGPRTRSFLRGVWRLGPWLVAAKAATMAAQLAAGRLLGAEEFGKANLCLSAGQWFLALQALWNIGVVKFAGEAQDDAAKSAVLSTFLWLSLGWTLICLAALWAVRAPLSARLHMPPDLYLWGILFGVAASLYTTAYSALQADMRFRAYGVVEFSYGMLALVLFWTFYRLGRRGYAGFMEAFCLAQVLAALAGFLVARRRLRLVFSMAAARDLAGYFFPSALNSASLAALERSFPFLLAAYFDPASVGVYSAYRLGSLALAKPASHVVGTVLLPQAAHAGTRRGAWRKLAAIAVPAALAGLVFFAAATGLGLKLFGAQYPLFPASLALFALAAAISLLAGAAEALLMARDSGGLWSVGWGKGLSAALALGAGAWLIPRWRIAGAGLTYCLSFSFFLAWCFLFRGERASSG